MEGMNDKLSDEDVALIATCVRSTWNNKGGRVTPRAGRGAAMKHGPARNLRRNETMLTCGSCSLRSRKSAVLR